MKLVANLTSGVKNFVSSTVSWLRGVAFIQVKSPNANGVSLSTPGGPGSGAERASGITSGGFAGVAVCSCGAGWGPGKATSGVSATGLSNAVAGGVFNEAVVDDPGFTG